MFTKLLFEVTNSAKNEDFPEKYPVLIPLISGSQWDSALEAICTSDMLPHMLVLGGAAAPGLSMSDIRPISEDECDELYDDCFVLTAHTIFDSFVDADSSFIDEMFGAEDEKCDECPCSCDCESCSDIYSCEDNEDDDNESAEECDTIEWHDIPPLAQVMTNAQGEVLCFDLCLMPATMSDDYENASDEEKADIQKFINHIAERILLTFDMNDAFDSHGAIVTMGEGKTSVFCCKDEDEDMTLAIVKVGPDNNVVHAGFHYDINFTEDCSEVRALAVEIYDIIKERAEVLAEHKIVFYGKSN